MDTDSELGLNFFTWLPPAVRGVALDGLKTNTFQSYEVRSRSRASEEYALFGRTHGKVSVIVLIARFCGAETPLEELPTIERMLGEEVRKKLGKPFDAYFRTWLMGFCTLGCAICPLFWGRFFWLPAFVFFLFTAAMFCDEFSARIEEKNFLASLEAHH